MPIYEYVCNECRERFEKLVRYPQSTPTHPPCPACHGENTERVVSSFAQVGASGADPSAARAEAAERERLASITPKEQIDKWKSQRSKKP
jgi:putative FmdB family regulatory protein